MRLPLAAAGALPCVLVFSVLLANAYLSEGREQKQDYEARQCLLSPLGHLVVANFSLRNDSIHIPVSLNIPLKQNTFNCNPLYHAAGMPSLVSFEAGCVLQCQPHNDGLILLDYAGHSLTKSTQLFFLILTYNVSADSPSELESSISTKVEVVPLSRDSLRENSIINFPSSYGAIRVQMTLDDSRFTVTFVPNVMRRVFLQPHKTTPGRTPPVETTPVPIHDDPVTDMSPRHIIIISYLVLAGFLIISGSSVICCVFIMTRFDCGSSQKDRLERNSAEVDRTCRHPSMDSEEEVPDVEVEVCTELYNSAPHPSPSDTCTISSPASTSGYSGDCEAPGECRLHIPTERRRNNHVETRRRRRQLTAIIANSLSSFSSSSPPLSHRFCRMAPLFAQKSLSNGWNLMPSLPQSLLQISETEPVDHDEEGQIQAAQSVSMTRLQTIGDLSSSAPSLSSGSVREEPQGALSQQNLYEFPPSLQSGNLPSIAFSTRPTLAVSDSNISSSGIEPVDEEGPTPLAQSVNRRHIPERVNVANERSRPTYAGFSSSGSERDVPTAVTTIGYPTSPLMCSDLDDESERPARV